MNSELRVTSRTLTETLDNPAQLEPFGRNLTATAFPRNAVRKRGVQIDARNSFRLTTASVALSPAEKEMVLSGCILGQDLVDHIFGRVESF
jgi:hypothetical protein